MKKMLLGVVVISAGLLAGCVGRPLNAYDRAAILGASENQALQNAHNAVWDQDEHRGSAHHHKRHKSDQDAGEVTYHHGQAGYLDAQGEWHPYGEPEMYAQSAHKRPAATYKQITAEAEASIGCPISQAADFLLDAGWRANQGKWHKAGYILTLVVEDGLVVNAQVTK